MRRRGVKSPNLGDALAYAFAPWGHDVDWAVPNVRRGGLDFSALGPSPFGNRTPCGTTLPGGGGDEDDD
jgi:hypothetical protein